MKITKKQLRKLIQEKRPFRAGKADHEPSFSLSDYPGYGNFYGRGGGSGGGGYNEGYDEFDAAQDREYAEIVGEDPDLIDDDLGDAGYDPEEYEEEIDDIDDDLGENKVVRITKRQLRKIIKEEKDKLIQEQIQLDPQEHIYEVDQHLSDAAMKLMELADFLESTDPRRAVQFDSLSRQAEKLKSVVASHLKAMEGMPI